MCKKILFGVISLGLLSSFSFANPDFSVQGDLKDKKSICEKEGCGCQGKEAFGKDKFKDMSLPDLKSKFSEKISLKEQHIADEKKCLSKEDKNEFLSCIKQIRLDKKELMQEKKQLREEHKRGREEHKREREAK